MLKQLNEKNDVEILSVRDIRFESYGRIIDGFDFSELLDYMEEQTEIPENGNIYTASVSEMENTDIAEKVKNLIYGEMPIEIGYCNGRNTTYNGFEYHKGSDDYFFQLDIG